MTAVVRAFLGYLFLVMVVRIVGRRPGKQMTPFEFVLIFFIGGLALTAIVGDEVSYTNALCQIITVALGHYVLAWARSKSRRFARLVGWHAAYSSRKSNLARGDHEAYAYQRR